MWHIINALYEECCQAHLDEMLRLDAVKCNCPARPRAGMEWQVAFCPLSGADRCMPKGANRIPSLTLRQLDQPWFETGQLKNKDWDSLHPRGTTKNLSSGHRQDVKNSILPSVDKPKLALVVVSEQSLSGYSGSGCVRRLTCLKLGMLL
ncbi:hypothetical protein [Bradyrhizobium sp.]|uniref:hypothetical protein n=1 Tax=Bradyrhizobium sp. TaxID=376 RepID=UPI001652458A|nr:hypothetical protein [Bradyrhizobium sp.]